MRPFAISAIALAAVIAALPASAAIFTFDTALTPEVAGSSGSGFATVTFDTGLHQLSIDTDWAGLTGTTTVAHIHCCVASPGTVGVAVTPGTLPGFPSGVTVGSYSTTLDLTQSATYTAGFLAANGGTAAGAEAGLLAGLQAQRAYLNIHTNFAPGGEIRGFLVAVPEPQTWTLLILGFGAIGAAMRRGGAASPTTVAA